MASQFLTTLKERIAAYASKLDAEAHAALQKVAAFIEGDEAIEDAKALLRANGYAVIPSSQVAQLAAPAPAVVIPAAVEDHFTPANT